MINNYKSMIRPVFKIILKSVIGPNKMKTKRTRLHYPLYSRTKLSPNTWRSDTLHSKITD